MNDVQENKLSMFLAVQKVCKNNNGVWSGLPAFVSCFSEFEGKIADVGAASVIQEQSIKGVTEDKCELKERLADKVIEVSTAVQAYASENGDNELLESVSYSRSNLLRTRDTIVRDLSQLVHDKVNAVIGLLGDYGVVAGDLSDLQVLIDSYVEIIPMPRMAISERKMATEDVALHLREGGGILGKRMDKLCEQFRMSNPKFYASYHSARIIVDTGISGSILRGNVKDKQTGKRIDGGTVEIAELEVSRKISKKGRYSFKRVRPGIYTVRFSAEEYEAKEMSDVEIVESKMNELDVELDRVVEQPPAEPELPGA